MTCRERFYIDHSGMELEEAIKLLKNTCPSSYGYNTVQPEYCIGGGVACKKCWERECEKTNTEESKLIYAHTDISGENNQSTSGPVIKDSGNRREFESGAVRDMQEGKGRCDLMPLEVVANLINGRGIPEKEEGKVLHNVKTFLEKNDTYYLYLALEHFADRCYSRSIPTMFLEVAKHFEEGAKKYGENNWQKGIPPKCYIDSAIRHYLKWLRGDKDEPHDRAFVWNLMCCIWEVDYREKKENV